MGWHEIKEKWLPCLLAFFWSSSIIVKAFNTWLSLTKPKVILSSTFNQFNWRLLRKKNQLFCFSSRSGSSFGNESLFSKWNAWMDETQAKKSLMKHNHDSQGKVLSLNSCKSKQHDNFPKLSNIQVFMMIHRKLQLHWTAALRFFRFQRKRKAPSESIAPRDSLSKSPRKIYWPSNEKESLQGKRLLRVTNQVSLQAPNHASSS